MKEIFREDEMGEVAEMLYQKILHTKKTKEKAKEENTEKTHENNTATIVALSGDLGSGKTTLTKYLAKILGIKENIISPTFVLLKNYNLENNREVLDGNMREIPFRNFTHIDAYRFEKSSELLNLDWQNLISNSENLIILEWPEMVQDILPIDILKVSLEHIDEKNRKIILS